MTISTIHAMRDAINDHPGLASAGKVTECLPRLACLTFTFHAGLTVQIAAHPNGKVQATLDGFYALDPAPIDRLIDYLASLP